MDKVKKVRPVLQMEATECGAASLAMILAYYGKSVTLEELRCECGVSRNGVNAKSIVKAARYHGLKTRALRASVDGAKTIKTPAIIHWNMDHFLVLCGFNKKGAVLADPAYGLRTVSMEEFSRSFTGIAIELAPSESFQKDAARNGIADYISVCTVSFLPYTLYFIVLELCALIGSAAMLFLNSAFIDKILIGGNPQNLTVVLKTLLCAGLITAAAAALNENVRHRLGMRLNMRINSGFIGRMLRLPIKFYAQRSEGDLANRQNANMRMGINICRMLSPIPGYIMQAVVYLILIAVFDAHIAIIGLLCAAANAAAMLIGLRKLDDDMSSYSRDMGALQGDISRTIDIIETVKSCGAEDAMLSKLMAAGTQAVNTRTSAEKTGVYTRELFSFLNAFGAGMVLIAGVWKIFSGSMSTGILIAAQALAAAMLGPVGNAVNAGTEMQTLKGQTARTNDVMRYTEDDKFLDDKAEQTKDMDGDIRLSDVSFGYSPLDVPFIDGFELTVKKGGSVAITGDSGSGKSTIAKIIAGLYCESGGNVTFNGAARHDIGHYYFYSKIASVSQNIRLFEGTVRDNITMWDETIPYDDVVAAAKAACIHEDIIRRRNGYREHVSENGSNFSGGQRQRIEIARALVKKPSALILDEATSALDADTEERVMNNIKALGITLIVVAHRLSAIMDSDEILVMDKGRIIERGTHGELMKRNGAYSALVRSVG